MDGNQLPKMNAKHQSRSVRFRLAISAEKYSAYYQGSAQTIVVRSEDNKVIQFPASAVRGFVTHDGIFGSFEITFDENNKLIAVEQID